MARLITFNCTFLYLFLLFSCGEETREEKIGNYLHKKGLSDDSYSIGVLNPNHCGSCTDYSINWLCSDNVKYKNRIILTTGTIEPDFKQRLIKSGYKFMNATVEEVSRVGITLAVCTYIEMADGKVVKIDTVK